MNSSEYHKQQVIKGNISRTRHGMSHSKIHQIWIDMHQRCKNPKAHAYKNYGGRGIIVCKRWESFENFYTDMKDAPKGLSLERIDNDKGYFPSNCKWATREEQQNNSRANIIIEYQNQRLTIAQWADKIGMGYDTLRHRIRVAHWSIERALTRKIGRWV